MLVAKAAPFQVEPKALEAECLGIGGLHSRQLPAALQGDISSKTSSKFPNCFTQFSGLSRADDAN
jgi:hypothetical protein